MKHEPKLAFNGSKLTAMIAMIVALTAACDSPTHPGREPSSAAAWLQANAQATMQHVAGLAATQPQQLRRLSANEVRLKLSSAIEGLPAEEANQRLARFADRAVAGFDAELAAIREFAGEHYAAVMKSAQRAHVASLKQLVAANPGLEITFDCGLGTAGVGIADCEGEGEEWGGEWYEEGPSYLVGDESPYCLKEIAAYSGAYLATLATVRAYMNKPTPEAWNAVLFATAAWFYAADTLSMCIERHFH